MRTESTKTFSSVSLLTLFLHEKTEINPIKRNVKKTRKWDFVSAFGNKNMILVNLSFSIEQGIFKTDF